MRNSTTIQWPVLALACLLAGCGGGGSGGNTTPIDPVMPPAVTTATITIVRNTTSATMYAGDIFGKSGANAFARVNFVPQDNRCSSQPTPAPCTYTVPIGSTVTLAASDVQAEPRIGDYTVLATPDDPRTIQSQFVNWTGPCATPERGVCVINATGNVTVTASFKPLVFTKFLFSGLVAWELIVTGPPTLGLTYLTGAVPLKVSTSYGVFTTGSVFARCIGLAPGVRCISIRSADNATIKMDAYLPPGPAPLGSPGPLNFVGFSGVCSGQNVGPSQFGISSCSFNTGSDQTAIMKWEYYSCLSASQTPFASEGTSGWKLPAVALNGCTLTQ